MKILPLVLLALSLVTVTAQEATPTPQITVSGTADVKVVPDEVLIHVGVETRNENLDLARHQHDDRMKSVLAFINKSGVPSKDVQTDYINLVPEYEGAQGQPKKTVYVVRKFIEVRL